MIQEKVGSEILWLEEDIPGFLKKLAKQNNLSGDFYLLPYSKDIIYLTKQQSAYAKAHKLLDLLVNSKGDVFNAM